MEQYHKLSDETMDMLLENLEELVENHGDPTFEVEYHVCSPVRYYCVSWRIYRVEFWRSNWANREHMLSTSSLPISRYGCLHRLGEYSRSLLYVEMDALFLLVGRNDMTILKLMDPGDIHATTRLWMSCWTRSLVRRWKYPFGYQSHEGGLYVHLSSTSVNIRVLYVFFSGCDIQLACNNNGTVRESQCWKAEQMNAWNENAEICHDNNDDRNDESTRMDVE